jgi:hypothetical protein
MMNCGSGAKAGGAGAGKCPVAHTAGPAKGGGCPVGLGAAAVEAVGPTKEAGLKKSE